MTTEEEFQRALDARPHDRQLRLVFADWLEERGDPRATGYRALARGGYRPFIPVGLAYQPKYAWCREGSGGEARWHDDLPSDWFDHVMTTDASLASFPTRQEAEDAAALAFEKLPAERQTALLSAGA